MVIRQLDPPAWVTTSQWTDKQTRICSEIKIWHLLGECKLLISDWGYSARPSFLFKAYWCILGHASKATIRHLSGFPSSAATDVKNDSDAKRRFLRTTLNPEYGSRRPSSAPIKDLSLWWYNQGSFMVMILSQSQFQNVTGIIRISELSKMLEVAKQIFQPANNFSLQNLAQKEEKDAPPFPCSLSRTTSFAIV